MPRIRSTSASIAEQRPRQVLAPSAAGGVRGWRGISLRSQIDRRDAVRRAQRPRAALRAAQRRSIVSCALTARTISFRANALLYAHEHTSSDGSGRSKRGDKNRASVQ